MWNWFLFSKLNIQLGFWDPTNYIVNRFCSSFQTVVGKHNRDFFASRAKVDATNLPHFTQQLGRKTLELCWVLRSCSIYSETNWDINCTFNSLLWSPAPVYLRHRHTISLLLDHTLTSLALHTELFLTGAMLLLYHHLSIHAFLCNISNIGLEFYWLWTLTIMQNDHGQMIAINSLEECLLR